MERTLIQPLIAVLVSSVIAFRAYKKKSLDVSGAFFGFLVMSAHLALNVRCSSSSCSSLFQFDRFHSLLLTKKLVIRS